MAPEPIDDWQVLGIAPGATPEEVFRAYSRRKALYSADSLASYSLHDDDSRQAMLDRIEEAYSRITAATGAPRGEGESDESKLERPTGPPPDVAERPGAFLRHLRTRRRTTLVQLSEETKIRASVLEMLEAESFADLPARVYVRGFVLQYARALGLDDPDRIAAAYLAKLDDALGSS
jgi:flagellar biosynthesis protein FlhG